MLDLNGMLMFRLSLRVDLAYLYDIGTGDLALQLAVNQQLFPQNNVCNNMLHGCP